MKLYTSYWAQVRNFPPNLIGLNTTIFPPRWRPLGQDARGVWVIDCPPLKPGASCAELCRGDCNPKDPNNCAFLREYRKQLDAIDINQFIDRLRNLESDFAAGEHLNNVDFALIVFETAQNPCSERWTLQSWLRENGVECEEWRK